MTSVSSRIWFQGCSCHRKLHYYPYRVPPFWGFWCSNRGIAHTRVYLSCIRCHRHKASSTKFGTRTINRKHIRVISTSAQNNVTPRISMVDKRPEPKRNRHNCPSNHKDENVNQLHSMNHLKGRTEWKDLHQRHTRRPILPKDRHTTPGPCTGSRQSSRWQTQ